MPGESQAGATACLHMVACGVALELEPPGLTTVRTPGFLQANREIFSQKFDTPVLSLKDPVIKCLQGMTLFD
jgi:hypothetical protein